MKKIIPHLWFDTQAKEAAAFYVSIFKDSSIKRTTVIKDTPSGDCDFVQFTLAGMDFMGISAGPAFKFNPSISFFVVFDNEAEIKEVWDKLIDGGEALMEYDTYPWAQKYGWLKDKHGLSWQLSWNDKETFDQKITPLLMYTKDMSGKAEEAMKLYTSTFPNSSIDMISRYEKGEGDTEGNVKHARFTLNGQRFMAMESSGPHDFTFSEAISLLVSCDTQEEIDTFSDKLSAHPEYEQCGWIKDKYGVSWQMSPTFLDDIYASGDEEKIARVTQAFLKMKRVNIAEMKKAFEA
jgi:predicted 3-demethylubiquinone-9 3-methyltransferase (glyoxalase superfamily)